VGQLLAIKLAQAGRARFAEAVPATVVAREVCSTATAALLVDVNASERWWPLTGLILRSLALRCHAWTRFLSNACSVGQSIDAAT